MYLCVGVSFLPLSMNFSIGFWNCSDSVVFFVFVLLNVKKMMKKDSPCYTNICNNVLYTIEAVDTLD